MIPGKLDYRFLAQRHRPADPSAIGVEIRRQASQGLKPRDIASALNVHIDVVLLELREVKS